MSLITEKFDPWRDATIAGILLLVMGLLMIMSGYHSLKWILMFAGVIMLITGAIATFDSMNYGNTIGALMGVVGAAIGLALIAVPNFFADALMVILAIALIIVGAMTLFDSQAEENPKSKTISLAVGVLLLIMGVYSLLNLHDTADIVIRIIGVVLVLSGAVRVFITMQLKSAS